MVIRNPNLTEGILGELISKGSRKLFGKRLHDFTKSTSKDKDEVEAAEEFLKEWEVADDNQREATIEGLKDLVRAKRNI